MPVQQRNSEMVDLLSAEFQLRYEPNFAWKSAVSSGLVLPTLRAFWPMSSVDYAAATQGRDLGGSAYHLTNNNSADFGYEQLAPYVEFDGTNQYLSRADGGGADWADIIGTEAFVESTQRGLTLGGWFYFDNESRAEDLMTKWAGEGQQSYRLTKTVFDEIQFTVTTDGATDVGVTSEDTVDADTWYYLVGRFDPSTALDVFIYEDSTQNVVGVPASIFDSTANFCIGATSAGGTPLDGKASLCSLCAAAHSDAIIKVNYQYTRAMFGI